MKSQKRQIMKSSNLPYAFYEETSAIANTEASSAVGKIEICREKLVHAFTYKYLKLLSSALVCVPNKNLTNKFVTLNAIVILKMYKFLEFIAKFLEIF